MIKTDHRKEFILITRLPGFNATALRRFLGCTIFLLAQAHEAWAATAPTLGAASNFAVLGSSTVTNTGTTIITGDVGVSPGTIAGTPMSVSGTVHAADASAANAQLIATSAYNDLTGQSCNFGPFDVTDLAGVTLTPGVYCYSSSLSIASGGVLRLDAGGDANAVWVFKIGSTLTTVSGASVALINGAQQSNVFWQVGSSATLGPTTVFKGTIIALTSITLATGASVSGRVWARNAAVTLDTNTVSVPQPSMAVLKSVQTYSDPVNLTSNPKAIPGAVMAYTVNLTNSGTGPVDINTTVITDQIPVGTALFVGDINGASSGPVWFIQGAASSGLTYLFSALGDVGDDVEFSNNGGASWAYAPSPGSDGCDPVVTHVRINPKGTFVGSASAPYPGFSLGLRVCVK
jgi:uncharacterized repeat protein (TIGR01451 family)